MNSLLKRQVFKLIQNEQLKDLKPFLNAVNESYDNFEDQLSMSQHAMKVSSDELFEANKKLREEANGLKEINQNLAAILSSMNLDANKLSNQRDFSQADYLKNQAQEIVAINEQREQLLKNLAIQNEELNDYAHVVSHDLKAPLRNIDTLVNWVIEDNKDEMQEKCLNSLNLVLSNVEKMDLLIKGILDYSTIDKLESEDRQINFNLIIEEVLRSIKIPENFEIKIDKNLPIVYGNAARYKQVFKNLIQNSITYNDKEIGIINIGVVDNEGHYEFFINDNGLGIKSIYFDRIFKVFTKLENNNLSSGVGLSIVKKIIQFYKGTIWLESEEKKGTTFYFTIPKK